MSRWVIVLSGGEGTRMQELIEECFAHRYPKQYCTFCGSKSMLEHTVDRALQVVRPERILTVVGGGHCRFFDEELLAGRVIEQPKPRDTAAGVLLPATYIQAEDPEAIVAILPSDHFIYPKARFVEQLNFAFEMAESRPAKMVLMGAVPDAPESDYGWIQPGEEIFEWNPGDLVPRTVNSFREKPDRQHAARWLANGWLWNTSIVVAKMKTLWGLAAAHMPEVSSRFTMFHQVLLALSRGGVTEERVKMLLHQIYQNLPKANFSRDLLEKVSGECIVLPLNRVVWSDWGRPVRVVETLEQIGRSSGIPDSVSQFVGRSLSIPEMSSSHEFKSA